MFIYCDGDLEEPKHNMVDKRLDGQMHLNDAYYNLAISDYQCIGDKDVGSDCIYKPNQPGETYDEATKFGVCVLTQSLRMMGSRIEFNYPV
jgi:hypothetical protein